MGSYKCPGTQGHLEADGPSNTSACNTSSITFLNCCQPLNILLVPAFVFSCWRVCWMSLGSLIPPLGQTTCTTTTSSMVGDKLLAVFKGEEILPWLLSEWPF